MRTKINLVGAEMVLMRGDHIISKKSLGSCQRIYRAYYDLMIGGDGAIEYFFVIRWDSEIWLMEPDRESEVILDELNAPKSDLTIFKVPYLWRYRFLKFLPLFPRIRSGKFPVSSLTEEFQ